MYVLVAHQSAPCDCFDNALTPPFKSMSYLRYLSTILLTLTMFYGWASPSVATSQFVCRGVGLTEPERSSLWNLSDVSTLDKAGLNLAPRYVATSVHDGDSVRTIISEIIDGRQYGTIQSTRKYSDGKDGWYNVMKVKGDENGRIIHEFLASHTKVEWGRILVEDGKNSSNFITTTNEEDADGAAMFLFMNQLRYGYHLREKIHNHFGSPEPSDWNGDYKIAYGIECILGYHIKHKILFFEKDANSNITPKYYEYSPKDKQPTQDAINEYGILPK